MRLFKNSSLRREDESTSLLEKWRWIEAVCIDCGHTFTKRSTARKTRRCPDCTEKQRLYRKEGHKISAARTQEWRAEGRKCHNCGAVGEETHHKIRLADGGSYDESNMVFLCGPCHDRQHYSSPKTTRGWGRTR